MSGGNRDSEGFDLPAKAFSQYSLKYDYGRDDQAITVGVTNDESVFHGRSVLLCLLNLSGGVTFLPLGALSRARRDSRSLADFSSGVGYWYCRRAGKDFAILIPLIGWLSYFGSNPDLLADHLEAKAKELVRRWKETNCPIKDGGRHPLGWAEKVYKTEWRNPRGKNEITIFEISLNSYYHTANNQWTRNPEITLGDLKLLIKTRSSVSLDTRPDKSSLDADGLSLDNKGETPLPLSPVSP
jgi:hypothetical protein